ncbi:hypothetical protein [Stutzerimonas chloritidismutans]|uniref:hypothetical protein n=1 Tax=Stutzerimonas chloritidismutans TaxID=203192 RepID=UPI003F141CBE
MSGLGVAWLMMGVSLCAVLVLIILQWLQWLNTQQHKVELTVLRSLLQSLGDVIQRLERENAELAAALRVERRQAEQRKAGR